MDNTSRRRLVSFWLIGYSVFMVLYGTAIPTPLYELYQEAWQFSDGILTLIFSVYALSVVPGSLIFGQISDQIGRRKVVFTGLLVMALGSATFVIADGVTGLFAGRIVQGFGVGILTGAATAALVELRPDAPKLASIVSTGAFVGGTAMGAILTGAFAQYGPAALQGPYLVHLGLLIPGFVGVYLMPETIQSRPVRRVRLRRPTIPPSIRFRFLIGVCIGFITMAVIGMFLSLAPSYITALLGIENIVLSAGIVSLVFGASGVAQISLRRFSYHRMMTLGMILLVAGLCGFVVAVPIRSVVLLLSSSVLTGLGHGLSFMGAVGFINGISPDENRGDVVSAFYAISYIGLGLPTVGIGFSADVIGLYHAVLVFTVLLGVSGIALVGIIRLKINEFSDDSPQPGTPS
ncbi:MFS transporter [Halostella sp. PRR32]|uniref:MFS transporter n=1 Tax=Halostella sp. PRR32 TaxID=3098147 RepID=UPI002B1E4133|nr:MFS transporter [Halostella sp. PRR32]